MSHLDTEIIEAKTLEAMVDAYKIACQEIEQAFSLMKSAKDRMHAAYGDVYGFDVINQLKHYSDTPESIKHEFKKDAWRALLNRIGIKKFMSTKDIKEMEAKFDDSNRRYDKDKTEIPDIELSTLIDIINGLSNTTPDYLKNLALEAFKILTPGRGIHNTLKTNVRNGRRAIGEKVILLREVECAYGNSFNVNRYRSENELTCIDKIFHLLDGKGSPKGYRSPLVDAINTTSIDVGAGETDYFKFKCCKNGNLHITFKNMELVKKLNQIAGGDDLTD